MASTANFSIIDTAKFTHVIHNFSSLTICLWSHIFKPPNFPNYRFQLNIYPKCTFQSFENDVFFGLWITPTGKTELPIQYRVSIIDAMGVQHCTRGMLFRFLTQINAYHNEIEVLWNYSENSKYGRNNSIIRFLTRDYLINSANGLLPGDKLTIYCEVDILSDKIPLVHETHLKPTSKLEDNIQKDFESLLENGKLSDVVLVVGKKELHAHKLILAARSKVFGAMFENKETKESLENRVEIPDVDGEVFEQLLMYIYTGKIPSSIDENALELFVSSDKYELNHLKSICEQSLGSSLTIESVVSTFVVADMHQVADLKSKCIEFITEHSDKVMATDGWSKFVEANRFELLHQLFQAISAKLIGKK